MEELVKGRFNNLSWVATRLLNNILRDDLEAFKETLQLKLEGKDKSLPGPVQYVFNLMEEAAYYRAIEITKYLVTELGVDVNMPSIHYGPVMYRAGDNMTPLSIVLRRLDSPNPNSKEMVEFLISAGANITEDDAVKIKELFGGNAGAMVNSMGEKARARRKAAVNAWQRDRNAWLKGSAKGGSRSSRRSRRKKQRSRSLRNRY